MKKQNARKKTQQKPRKQGKKGASAPKKAGGQTTPSVKGRSTVSMIAMFGIVLLVALLVVVGIRKASGNKAALPAPDIGQPSGPSGITNTSSSKDKSITYKDPSDTSTPVSNSKAQDTAGGETAKAIDLTVLSSTMIYAEVYNIMTHPDEYMGKTIKMSGPYYASFYDATGLYYHYVVIEDATACCQQGLEFNWKGEHIYPDDYPEDGTKIEVTGVFSSYDELGRTYYYIAVDDISIL